MAWSGVGWRGGDRTGAVKDDRAGQRGGPAGCGCVVVEGKAGLLLPASFLPLLCWDLRQWVRRRSGQKPAAGRGGCPFEDLPAWLTREKQKTGAEGSRECLLHCRPLKHSIFYQSRHLAECLNRLIQFIRTRLQHPLCLCDFYLFRWHFHLCWRLFWLCRVVCSKE